MSCSTNTESCSNGRWRPQDEVVPTDNTLARNRFTGELSSELLEPNAAALKRVAQSRQRRARPACSPLGYNKNDMHYASMNDDQSDSAQHHRDRRRVVWNFIAQQ
jgi:hypothetical protein